ADKTSPSVALSRRMRKYRAETTLAFIGTDERTDHVVLSRLVTQRKLIEDVEPEIVSALVRIAPQIVELLSTHKGGIVFAVDEGLVFGNLAQHRAARFRAAVQSIYQVVAIRLRERIARICV